MRKLILHIHLFKNAGSSIDQLLEESFGSRWANFDGPFPWSRILADELSAFADAHPELSAISSHQVRPPLPQRADWQLFPIVFLRHPIDRVASVYLFERRNGPVPADVSFADFIRWHIGRTTSTDLRNFQVAALSGAAADSSSPRGADPGSGHLEKAKDFLRSTPMFGIVENFEQSLLRIEKFAKPHFPELNLRTVHANSTPNRPSSLDERIEEVRAHLGEDLWARLLEANALDMELYQYGVELFGKNQPPEVKEKKKVGFRWMFRSKLKAKIASLEEERKELRRENKRLEKRLKAKKESPFAPPGNPYSPIPGAGDIDRAIEALANSTPLEGVDFNDEGQMDLLGRLASHVNQLPFPVEPDGEFRYGYSNPAYSYGDAVPLFCMLMETKPRRIIEMGCGFSSCLLLDTNDRFFNNGMELTFIDPYPQRFVSLLKPGEVSRLNIVEKKLQDVELDVFRTLEKGDVLFIDSSHVAKTGSDVRHLFARILPILATGVIIHFHDMFGGFEYPEDWLREGRAWNEQYFMLSFLQYNGAFRIKLFTDYMRKRVPKWFAANMEPCLRGPSANLWLERIS